MYWLHTDFLSLSTKVIYFSTSCHLITRFPLLPLGFGIQDRRRLTTTATYCPLLPLHNGLTIWLLRSSGTYLAVDQRIDYRCKPKFLSDN